MSESDVEVLVREGTGSGRRRVRGPTSCTEEPPERTRGLSLVTRRSSGTEVSHEYSSETEE